jgi:hypothetical protein
MTYLFTRRASIAPGKLVDAMAWAVKMTEHVNAATDLDLSLWTTAFSPKLGEVSWTTVVPDLVRLEAAEAKLTTDGAYLSLVGEAAAFSNGEPADDGLVSLVLADPDRATSDRQYASVVSAVLASGSAVRGVELGVEIAQRAKRITGCSTSFGTARTGVYGGVGWITVYDSVDELQRAGEAIAADAAFAALLDKEASKAYRAGASSEMVYRRIM